MSDVPEALSDAAIAGHLASLPGWVRAGDEITRTFRHTYHECVHVMLYVAARAEELGHHPDMHLTWQRVRFVITTHDAGNKLTVADFELARHIDAIAAARGATPVEQELP